MAIFLAAMYVNIPVYSNSRSIPVSLPAGTLEGHLPNGLHYLILQNPSPVSRVEFRLVMRVGSVQETEQQKGSAHFLEHVAFGGTTHFPKRSLVEYLESQGMKYGQDINAFTGFDRTIYMFAVPTDHQKEEAVNRSLLIMRDWLDGISMIPEKVENEKGNILEELRGYDLGDDTATMIKDGFKLICIPDGMVYIDPVAGYYQDYLNEPYLYKEWTPAHIGKSVIEEKHPSILGGMFAIWNDHAGNGISVKDIHHRIFSPLQTLSVKMWTGAQTGIPYETFNEKRALLSEAPGVNQLARIGTKPGLVYERSTVAPGSTSDYPEIGYNYTVSFDITGAEENEGTELFRSPNAVFYLSDPIRGMMGFARDGYLNTFPYKVNPGEKATIQIEGNNRSTTLRVNGKVVEEMNTQKLYFNAGKDSMSYVRTLVFPLEKAGNFNSKVQNLKVYNYCVSKP